MAAWLLLSLSPSLKAQMPFYTDDAEVTDVGTLHVESFDEIDALQSSQYPDLRQNTVNLKLNAGLPDRLEIDLDAPYLTIGRAPGVSSSQGIGDTDFGIKWKAVDASAAYHRPALAASLYIEVPTGNVRQELGSGLTDYWLNLIAQMPLSDRTHLNANLGILFAGNTSTGVVGIDTTRGQVYTAGLSVVRAFNRKVTLGAEIYGGMASDRTRKQLQGMLGMQYSAVGNVAICLGLVAGEFATSPKLGAQLGIEADFPDLLPFLNPSNHHAGGGLARPQ